jgi:tetratricopeptide (TPR) repeat protein
MLRQRSGPEVAERLARHLTEAGELRMALEPLRDAASQRLATGDYALADALLSEREQALVTLESDEADVSWIEGWLLRGELAAKRGSFDVGLKWATLAADAAREHGHEALHARGLLLRGKLERMRGDAGRAEPDLERAEALARGLDDDRLLAEVLESLGRVSMHKGALERAEGCLIESLQLWRRARDRRGAAETTWALAHLMTYRKRYDEAFDYNHEALEVIRSSGDRWSTARCLNTAGEIARVRGLLEDAEHYYRKAGEMMATIGANDSALVCECNVARVLAERGEYGQARVTLSRAVAAFERQERKNPLSWVYCVLLVCDAGERDWSAWAHHLGRALEVLQDTSYLDLDIATVAELAGNLARDAGEPKHAAAAYQLSAKQWRGLERNEDGARVEMALRQLRPKEA